MRARKHENQNSLAGMRPSGRPVPPPLPAAPRCGDSVQAHTCAHAPGRLCSPHILCLFGFGGARMGTGCTLTIGSFRDPPAAVPYVSVMNKHRLCGWGLGSGSCQSPPSGRGRATTGWGTAWPSRGNRVLTRRDPGGQSAFLETGKTKPNRRGVTALGTGASPAGRREPRPAPAVAGPVPRTGHCSLTKRSWEPGLLVPLCR